MGSRAVKFFADPFTVAEVLTLLSTCLPFENVHPSLWTSLHDAVTTWAAIAHPTWVAPGPLRQCRFEMQHFLV